jgi:ABC-type Fe3+ transport system substrate-binding protein
MELYVKIGLCALAICFAYVISAVAADDRTTVLAKSKEEKALVVYNSMELIDANALIEAFKKKYPDIETKLFRLGGTQMPVRVLQEHRAGVNLVDVIQAGDFVYYEISRANLFQPYESPERRAYPADFKDKEGLWTSTSHNAGVISYNTDMIGLENAPRSYSDLLDPKWKGKMLLDVNGPEWYAGMLQVWGREKGLNFMKSLAKQEVSFRQSKVLANQVLMSGEFGLLINNYEHLVQAVKKKGAPVQSVAADPVLSRVHTIALTKNAPHPNAGRLYIDFVLSEEGQKILRGFGRSSSRKGMEPDELQKRGIKLHVTDMSLAKDLGVIDKEFKEIFGIR